MTHSIELSLNEIPDIELRWKISQLRLQLLAFGMGMQINQDSLQRDAGTILDSMNAMGGYGDVSVLQIHDYILTRNILMRGTLEENQENVRHILNPGITAARITGPMITSEAVAQSTA